MKSNAIIRIVVLSLAILVLLGILLGVLALDTYHFSFKSRINRDERIEEVTSQIDLEYVSADIRKIEIDWVAGNITLQRDAYATEINIQEISPIDFEHKMVLKQSGQTLKIKYSDRDAVQFPFGTDLDISKDLIITVPMDWECDSLEIDTAAAEVIINDLTIREFNFDGASGICRLSNCNVGELDIDTASGDIYFTGVLETLDCDAASADCTIEVTNIPRSIKLDGMSGDLELVLPPYAGFTCTMDTMSGDFESDFEFKSRNDIYICGDGDCRIEVSGMSGAVSVLKGIE